MKQVRSYPIIVLAQLTFYHLVSYFDGRRTQGADAVSDRNLFTSSLRFNMLRIQQKGCAHRVVQFDRQDGVYEIKTAFHGAPKKNNGDNIQVYYSYIVSMLKS